MSTIAALLEKGRRAHLIGAGGVSMSALAEVLANRGLSVTGSDRQESEAVLKLRRLGIPVERGESGLYVHDADVVIRTAAAREDNPEVALARSLGKPLLERADAWGELMRGYERVICVAGTHGKTTTTGMLTHIAMESGSDPSVMMGGQLPLLGAGHRVGASGLMIAEACEYHNSYHRFRPTAAVLLNIEADHLDFFSGLDELIASFRDFARLVPPDGVIIANGDDINVRKALDGLNVLWLGSDFRAEGLVSDRGRFAYNVVYRGTTEAGVRLKVPGMHNVQNSLAAAAAALANGLSADAVSRGLASFTGIGRRMEYRGSVNGADIYDDYAHHPSAIAATLTAASAMGYRRVLCVFQPHTYTRTKALFKEFAAALTGFDRCYLSDIYAAREADPGGVSSEALAARIPGAVYTGTAEATAQTVLNDLKPGDILLTMGAGDVYKVAELLIR
ncbi:MAG: UDP-N-acetylmuramate--L-alanine ligase [Oscillospiraceae bacterium]|nr:UDP-N-acetylmuramate--L-alanine ligase [Oscillospiraceae bacterium]